MQQLGQLAIGHTLLCCWLAVDWIIQTNFPALFDYKSKGVPSEANGLISDSSSMGPSHTPSRIGYIAR